MKTRSDSFSCWFFEENMVQWKKSQEGITMDMDTLGFFIFMDEMEKKSQEQEDRDEDEAN